HALDQGVEEIILGLGGSATCDAGVGMAQALGYQFLGEEGNCLHPVGKDLSQIAQIDATQVHPRLHHVSISIACDVENPLYGPQGAAFIFAPQKGANQQEVRILDQGLQDIAHLLNRLAGKSVENILGAGAAGGMGAGAMAFLRGELQSGAALVGKWAGLSKQLADADLIITGEGKLDSQSKDGKLISYIMKEAHQANVPVIALCGSLNLDIKGIEELGLISAQSILTGPATLDQALKSTKKGLELAAYSAFRLYYLGRSM
ncbi:MAG: glycerate kinase, partial [Bacteroidota bacterium]